MQEQYFCAVKNSTFFCFIKRLNRISFALRGETINYFDLFILSQNNIEWFDLKPTYLEITLIHCDTGRDIASFFTSFFLKYDNKNIKKKILLLTSPLSNRFFVYYTSEQQKIRQKITALTRIKSQK